MEHDKTAAKNYFLKAKEIFEHVYDIDSWRSTTQ